MLEELKRRLSDYEVVLEPDEDTPEWWAGAPSVVRTKEGVFYMAARMREGRSPKGKRGYEIRILRSEDGRRFEAVHRIARERAGVEGFERPALAVDPTNGLFKLYGCTPLEKGWGILKFEDADKPEEFRPESARTVLWVDSPADDTFRVTGYKDPVLLWNRGQWHMFVIGLDRVERIFHFTSGTGESWKAVSDQPVMPNDGWHNFHTRPASVLPMPVGSLFVYEGSNLSWFDPNYNIASGLAFTPDLGRFYDLTPEGPLLQSTTPGDLQTWRYSDWIQVGPEVFVYFEAARPNRTNEIRVASFPVGLLT